MAVGRERPAASLCPQAESEMAVLKQELEATRALSLAMGAGLAAFAASSG
jgi:hypothetical protein